MFYRLFALIIYRMKKLFLGSHIRKRLDCYKYYLQGNYNWVFILYAVVSVTVGFCIYNSAGKMALEKSEEQMQHRATVLVKAEASLIKLFFEEREKKLLYMANLPEIINNTDGPQAQKVLNSVLADAHSEVVNDVIRIDKDGLVTLRASGVTTEDDISKIGFFPWIQDIKNKGKVLYSGSIISPGGLSKGNNIVAIVVPVWKGNTFNGAVAKIILINEVVDEFLKPLEITNQTNSVLIDNQGVVQAAVFPNMDGLNLFDYTQKYKWKGYEDYLSFLNNLIKGREGKAKANFRYPDGSVSERLYSYAPIRLASGDYALNLVVCISEKDALPYTFVFYSNQFVVLVFFVMTSLGFIFLGIFVSVTREKTAYLEGFKEGDREDKP